VIWSDEKGKKEKGRMAMSALKSTEDGCPGAKNQSNAFTITFTSRTLELEANRPESKAQWMKALKWILAQRSS